MPTGRQRLAQQQIAAQAAAAAGIALEQAKVTAVSADTPPKVTVKWRGGTYIFPHLIDAYPSPAVGHIVAMAPYTGSWLILGRAGGFRTS